MICRVCLLYRQSFVCGKKTCELMNIKPETVAGALKICCKTDFHNIFIILKIIATLGGTSCECERSNSELSLLKTYLRRMMGQSRINGLALMYVHYSLVELLYATLYIYIVVSYCKTLFYIRVLNKSQFYI